MASNRTFGVEIECGHDNLNYVRAGETMEADGFEVADGQRWDPTFSSYSYSCDGSGIEIKTPILKGVEGYRELERVMDYLRDKGYWVTRSDGMHVHIGAKGFYRNAKACARLARTWYANRRLIERMCSNHRSDGHYGSPHCQKLRKEELPTLGQTVANDHMYNPRTRSYTKVKYKDLGNRGALNLQPLEDYGTIEFRLHEGCLDSTKAIAWVTFCQALVDNAWNAKEPIKCATSKTALLTTLGVPRDVRAVLAKRQTPMPRQERARYR